MATSGADLIKTEKWFISRGLPHFIEDYSASRDVFTRALPLLILVYFFEIFTALNRDWSWLANTLAVVGALVLLIGSFCLLNSKNGRPMVSWPRSIGSAELALFTLVPPVLPVVFGGKWQVALVTIATNAAVIGVIYLGTSYGVVPTTRWAIAKLWSQLGALVRLLTRALPLLLLFVTFLFINPDTWQVTAELYGIYFTSSLLLFAFIGSAFVIARLPKEIGDLNNFTTIEEVRIEVESAGFTADSLDEAVTDVPMSRRQWGNTGLVVLVSQGIQVLLIAGIVAVFLIVLGMLTIRPETVDMWIGHSRHVLLDIPYGHENLEITEELLRVSVFLASFSALYFTVVALTDATYREEFFRDVVSEVRQALAVRLVYLGAIRQGTSESAISSD